MKFNCGRCTICSPRVYAQWFGEVFKKPRRTHADVVLEQRKKKEAIANRKELHKRLRMEKEAKKLRRK